MRFLLSLFWSIAIKYFFGNKVPSTVCYNQNLGEEFFDYLIEQGYQIAWNDICFNQSLSLGFFERHREAFGRRYNSGRISANIKIDCQSIKEYQGELDWLTICEERKLPFEFWCEHIDKIDRKFISVYMLTEQFIERFPQLVNWSLASRNKTISEQFWERVIFQDGLANQLDWGGICRNDNLSEQFYRKIIDSRYASYINWKQLSSNKSLSEQFILEHIDLIDWTFLAYRPMSEQFLRDHIDKIKLGIIIDTGQQLPEQFLEDYFHLIPWDRLTRYNQIPLKFIEDNLHRIQLDDNDLYWLLFDKHFQKLPNYYRDKHRRDMTKLAEHFRYYSISNTFQYLI